MNRLENSADFTDKFKYLSELIIVLILLSALPWVLSAEAQDENSESSGFIYEDGGEIYWANINNHQIRNLTEQFSPAATMAAVSPEGRQIAFVLTENLVRFWDPNHVSQGAIVLLNLSDGSWRYLPGCENIEDHCTNPEYGFDKLSIEKKETNHASLHWYVLPLTEAAGSSNSNLPALSTETVFYEGDFLFGNPNNHWEGDQYIIYRLGDDHQIEQLAISADLSTPQVSEIEPEQPPLTWLNSNKNWQLALVPTAPSGFILEVRNTKTNQLIVRIDVTNPGIPTDPWLK